MIDGEGDVTGFVRAANITVDCTIVIVTFNNELEVEGLLQDLEELSEAISIRVAIVDNNSADDTVLRIRKSSLDIDILTPGANLGYSGGINFAVSRGFESDVLIILNPDVRFKPASVLALIDEIQSNETTGVSVPCIVDGDGVRQSSIRRDPALHRSLRDAVFGDKVKLLQKFSEIVREDDHYRERSRVDWATGAVLAIRDSCLREVGEWDDRFFLYSEETDFFRRVRNHGFDTIYVPESIFAHSAGASGASLRLQTLLEVSKVRYAWKLGRIFGGLMWIIRVLHCALRLYKPGGTYMLRVVANPLGYVRFVSSFTRMSTEIEAKANG